MNEIGLIVELKETENSFAPLKEFGLSVCQLVNWNDSLWREDVAARVKHDLQQNRVRVSALWAGVPGPREWNFRKGPVTLGLVPPEYRQERVASLKRAADFAAAIGAPAVVTHVGFIPENMTDPEFDNVVQAVREVAATCESKGLEFWFETGQETPVTLLRAIHSVGAQNLGINLDPANLILYGKGNPIDALDVFGSYVKNIHAKDGFYPTDPFELGQEVKVGQGKVNFPEFVKRLKGIGFSGEFIIEREISGEQQKRDIRETIRYLEKLLED
ncbi:MAG: sugar phosphate isomerase/epimerase [Calditrichaeota bacterium]|nr:sugar phosphate isomerase/epimerase [Calditrichota bacterium]